MEFLSLAILNPFSHSVKGNWWVTSDLRLTFSSLINLSALVQEDGL